MNMTALWVNGSIFLNNQKDKLKEKAKEIFLDETGAVDIVAIVVMMGIAVILAVVFREQIGGLLEHLAGTIQGQADKAIKDGE